jgi:molybdopterin converting factor small subunit
MTLTVEFFGIPRQRANCARCELSFEAEAITLRRALMRLAETFPAFGSECIRDGMLLRGYAANLNGERFIADPETVLHEGAELLILSADAGG